MDVQLQFGTLVALSNFGKAYTSKFIYKFDSYNGQ